MGKPKAQKYKSQRDRQRREKQRQAECRAPQQLSQVLQQTPTASLPAAPTSLPVAPTAKESVVFSRAYDWRAQARSVATFVIAVIGLIASIFALFPQISASPTDAVDPHNPSAALITIRNDNLFGLNDVRYKCVQVEAKDTFDNVYKGNWVGSRQNTIEYLGGYQPVTISCAAIHEEALYSRAVTTDFMMVVSFLPGVIPYRMEQRFRFQVISKCGGQVGRVCIVPQPEIPRSETGFERKWE